MKDLASLSDAELLAMYKTSKDPFEGALKAEGVAGPIADIARSIYQQESGSGKNTKTSNAGAMGGMQIIPGTFKSVADKDWDINDPTHNARAGIRYVKQLYDQAGGDPALTAAGYYGGPGGLEKARRGVAVADPRNPNAPTTLQYGQQVAARIPKEKGIIQRGVEAMIPSAEAAQPKSAFDGMSDDELMAAYQKAKQPAPPPADTPRVEVRGTSADEPSVASRIGGGFLKGTKDLAGGLVRGAGSIGATLLAPGDAIQDAIAGRPLMTTNNQRRQGVGGGLQAMGVDTDSVAYGAGKLGGEMAGTGGVGNILAAGAKVLKAAPQIVNALRSSGMTLGGAPAKTVLEGAGNLALRGTAGATTGTISAGLVNPEDAGMGGMIGAAVPLGAAAIAPIGKAIGNKMASALAEKTAAFGRGAEKNKTLQEGIQAGYVVPPSSVDPSLRNTIKESVSGKIATAQVASNRNQVVTDKLVRQSLGLADDVPLSVEALGKYRAEMHAAGYEPLRQVGMVKADAKFGTDLADVVSQYTGKGTIPATQKTEIADLVKAHQSKGFDSGDAVDAIRILREDAKDAFRKGDSAMGKAQKAIADAYEGALERSLPADSPLLKDYQAARKNIAKSFTVEDALKEGAGEVDARKLGAALQKGTPLSGELLTAARFASAFPKATQPPSLVAGPGVHNLKAGLSVGSAGMGGFLAGPVGAAAGAAYPFLVPPAVRAQMFSAGAQNRLIQQAPQANRLLQYGGNPEVNRLLVRAAPVLGTSGNQ